MNESHSVRARIFTVIREVPAGKVSTYGAIARAAGLPRGARQVAAALRGGFALPWHRILGAGGEIKLRGSSAFEQRMRLESEGVIFRGRRVNMSRHEHKFERGSKSRKAHVSKNSGRLSQDRTEAVVARSGLRRRKRRIPKS
jgi:methylated-DNA-protein-cysteine methyltransferase related protein